MPGHRHFLSFDAGLAQRRNRVPNLLVDRRIAFGMTKSFPQDADPQSLGRLAEGAHDDTANGFAAFQRCKSVVDLFQLDPARDQIIQHQRTIEIRPRQQREIAARTRVAVTDAANALFLHQGAPAKRYILVHVDLAEPDDLAARAHSLCRNAKCGCGACGLNHNIHAAAVGLSPSGSRHLLL